MIFLIFKYYMRSLTYGMAPTTISVFASYTPFISYSHTACLLALLFQSSSLRRPGQYHEKTNRSMIMAPLVGIILNLMDATAESKHGETIDIIGVFASMDCPLTVHCGFQYLLSYNWVSSFFGLISL